MQATSDFVNSLRLQGLVGSGGFAEVFQCSTDTGKYVLKTIPKDKMKIKNVEREVQAGQLLQHPNVVNFVTHFHDEKNYYLVLDFINGKDLFTNMADKGYKPFSEAGARGILSQLIDALAYCHKNSVVHFDVKLDNIIFEEETQKATLIDFGLCDFMEGDDHFTKRVGSEEYCAPELYLSEDTPYSGTKADIYALGVVLYAMLTCTFPFNDKKRKECLKFGLLPALYFPEWMNSRTRDLISKMLDKDPDTRITLDEIKNHPFMQQQA